MQFCVLIPARLASTRLPDKALADLNGKPMVVRVADVAAASGASLVAVATDDAQIAQAVEQAGYTAVMTDPQHPTGTDRLAQAAQILNLPDEQIVVNLQGDEPLMPAQVCRAVAQSLADHPDDPMATVVYPIRDSESFADPNVVKAVLGHDQCALYFSRASIPFCRDNNNCAPAQADTPMCWHHVGLYAYRVSFLKRFVQLPVSPMETVESLEQLRALWHGYRIRTISLGSAPPPGVDTADDLLRVRKILTGN